MDIKVNKIDSANAKAEAKVSNTFLEEKKNKIAKDISKNIEIRGFRKGKVPITVVKSRYKERIEQDSKSQALKDLLDEAIKMLEVEQNSIIGEPWVVRFDTKDDGLDIEVRIAFRPEIDLADYKEHVPDFKEPEVNEDEVKEKIDAMLKTSAVLKNIEEDRSLEEGDFALIDFEGFVNEEPFEGGKANGYSLEIGSKTFIEGFEDALIGMKKGETKEISVTFPENYNNKELAGKPAMFKVTLQEIQYKDIPEEIDEETAKRFLPNEENPSAELLEEKVKEQIKNEKLSKLYNEELKPKFVETIVEKVTFDLPENIVEQEIDLALRNKIGSMSEDEIKEYRQDPEKVKEIRESLRDEARKSVKLTFIVDELAKEQKVIVNDQEVVQMIYLEAMQQGQDPKRYLEYYEKQGLLPAVKMALVEDRVFTKIFDDKLKG